MKHVVTLLIGIAMLVLLCGSGCSNGSQGYTYVTDENVQIPMFSNDFERSAYVGLIEIRYISENFSYEQYYTWKGAFVAVHDKAYSGNWPMMPRERRLFPEEKEEFRRAAARDFLTNVPYDRKKTTQCVDRILNAYSGDNIAGYLGFIGRKM